MDIAKIIVSDILRFQIQNKNLRRKVKNMWIFWKRLNRCYYPAAYTKEMRDSDPVQYEIVKTICQQ